MRDSDIILAQLTNENTFELMDCYSDSNSAPQADTIRGGSDDVQLLGTTATVEEEKIIKFRRKINTLDRFDKDLTPNAKLDIFVARTDSHTIEQHGDLYWYYSVDFREGSKGEAEEQAKDIKKIIYAHFLINLIGWGFLADVGIFAAKNLRHYNFYIIIHTLCFYLTDIGTILVGVIMIVKRNKNSLN
jgi:hypothetical protein